VFFVLKIRRENKNDKRIFFKKRGLSGVMNIKIKVGRSIKD